MQISQLNLFDIDDPKEREKLLQSRLDPRNPQYNLNPMVRTNGVTTERDRKGKLETCRHCKHLGFKALGKRYYKCGLRGNSNSSATDHKVTWLACSKFERES